MPTVKVKTASGHIQSLREIEILEIDGKPFNGVESSPNELSSRVSILEHIVCDLLEQVNLLTKDKSNGD